VDCPLGHENPPGSAFCEECGATLERVCPACGAECSPAARFCRGCGASLTGASVPAARERRAYTPKHLSDKILQSRSALEGERKQVTVLFADVKGSMELAASLGAEQWHALLDRFFRILADGVHRFEGTVNQYTGDGIMALFGAPIAHEDHAQRACFAALHLRDELRRYADELRLSRGLDFSVRMGLNSGEVVVGRIGDDLRMDYTAQGHTVGLAARLQEIAGADRVCVSAETARIASGYFALRDLGVAHLKGVAEAVRVFELEGVGLLRTRFDLSRARGLSRFVGRANEMAALEAALEQAVAGRGQVLGVVAEAGTGKSRLCFEFAERCRAKGILTRVTEGVAHGKAVPLLPVLELYRAFFGITERDDERTARQKIAGAVVGADESLLGSLPLLYDFLGVPDPEKPVALEPGPERQRALLGLLKRLTLARSRREPTVILFEDLHWIDEATAVFLENLVDAVDGSRTLLVVNFRPEYQADWMRRSYYQQQALAPLDASAFAEMLGQQLGSDPTLRGLIERIHERTIGNPFFAEEMVCSLVESGKLAGERGSHRLVSEVAELDLPASVQAVLAARIDRLPESDKALLQTASVIGREFAESLLRRVADLEGSDLGDSLRALAQAEFLLETALYPEAEYTFKHPLTQEVAYGSQLRERRARVHEAVAKALAELHAERLDEHAALVAHHWEGAGDAAQAAMWHHRAAIWLHRRDQHAARRHFERVVELAGAEPASAEVAGAVLQAHVRLLQLGATLGLDFERAGALYRKGREIAARLDEPELEAGLIASYSSVAAMSAEGGTGLALDLSTEALRLLDRVSDPGLYVQVVEAVIGPRIFAGRPMEALSILEGASLRMTADSSRPESLALLFVLRARVLLNLGRLDEAEQCLDRARELAKSLYIQLRIETMRCFVIRGRGFPAGAVEQIANHVERTDRAGLHLLRVQGRVALAEAQLAAGRLRDATETIDTAIAIARETVASTYILTGFERIRAQILLEQGELVPARELVEALVAGGAFTPAGLVGVRLVLARALTVCDAAGEQSRIETILDELSSHSAVFEAPPMQAAVRVERSRLARALGDDAGWERELREAERMYAEMGATGHVERIEKELAA
jgi:class 3 adenylate cyclase/tetratricopeptide (TPR) repeat protein